MKGTVTSLLIALAVFGHEHYISRDGAWCWFADPRALWVDGKIAAGSVSKNGDIVFHLYDPKTKDRNDVVLSPKLEEDDHANPSFLRLPNGRLLGFFSKHGGRDMFQTETASATDFLHWTEPRKINSNDPAYKGPEGNLTSYTYPNPQMLSAEKNRIYLFWRGMNWKPTFSVSDDLGKTWSTGQILVSRPEADPGNRPYMKVAGDGKSRIAFAFTDGHPRNEPANSIYYFEYSKGALRNVKGEKIGDLKHLPLRPEKADVVYDAKSENARAWIWDVAFAPDENPVITYVRFPNNEGHDYRYAWWNGQRWVDRPVVNGGKWFPETPDGKTEPEPNYSGGLVLDHKDPRFVYVSRPINGRFEVERWFTPDGGDTWSHVALTGNSKHNSLRPFVIRGNRPYEGAPNALYMNASYYRHYTDFTSTIQGSDEFIGPFSPAQPMQAADAVFRWVRSNPSRHAKNDWTVAPLYCGVFEYAQAAKNDYALDWLRNEGESVQYKPGPRPSMADDVAVGQAFISLYSLDKKPEQLEPTKAWLDKFVAMPHTRSLEWKDGVSNEELAWCDSLFMAPPTMAMLSRVTGDSKYADVMSRLWWKTSDYLYDPAEHLYFRDSRYFNQKEPNGQKVFWSRGNGWVLAGLARVLDNLPANHPDRSKFEQQFKEMAARVAKLQTKDGTWHASLLDPAAYPHPETSGTGFFVYALAWGVNHGLLDRATYKPTIDKGYAALCAALDPNGRLMWVQPVGQDPKSVKPSDTDSYGVGAFLLASVQIDRLNNKP